MARHPPSNDPRHPRMILAREREEQTWDLYLRGASTAAIAETIGVTLSQARKIRTRAIARLAPTPESLEQLRQVAQAKIDQRRLEANRILAAHHPVLEKGAPVTVMREGPDGVSRPFELEDDGVRLQALDRLAKCDADERALWGLEAAQKFEHGGEDGGPIPIEVRVADLARRTEAVHLRSVPPPELPPAS